MKQTENIMANFNDIITPEPISMFPASDGYLLLLILLLSAMVPISLYAYKYHMRNLYRKDALKEIKRVKNTDLSLDKELTYVLQLLKRVAIVAYSRETVARLSGKKWWQFLEEKSHIGLGDDLEAYCESIYQRDNAMTHAKNSAVINYTTKWIKKHKGAKID